MSDPDPVLSPEMERLLREAASDPRSTLLRVPRPRHVQGLLERQGPVSPTTTGLTSVERQLLEVHRDELADLLLRACMTRLFAAGTPSPYIHRSKTATEDFEADPPETWRDRARQTLDLLRDEPTRPEGFELIERCVREPDALSEISITQLARASARLQPTDSADAWVAFDQLLQGHYETTLRLVPQILAGGPCPLVASACLEYRAVAQCECGDSEAAMRSYAAAAFVDQERAAPLASWLHMAIRAGHGKEASRAGALLTQLDCEPTPALMEFFRNYHVQRQAGIFTPTPEASKLARKLEQGAGSLARKVIDVFI